MSESNPVPPPVPQGAPNVIYVQQAEPKKKRGFLRWLLIAAAVVFLISFFFGIALRNIAVTLGDSEEVREKFVSGSSGADHKVVIITVSGMIAEGSGGVYGSGSVARTLAELRHAQKDKSVVGVVLEVNSPGGTVTGSDLILHEVEKTKEAKKRVVVWMGGLAASGGYYISCKADKIYASPATITGSIGVIADLVNVEKLADKVGVDMVAIKSGKFKDMGSPFRAMTDEERAKFQAFVDGSFKRFKDVIKEGRKGSMKPEDVDRIADGSILSADDALKAGMVDKIDYIDAAIDDAKAGETKVSVVRYSRSGGLLGALLDSKAPSNTVNVKVETPVPQLNPGLYYLWLPGVPTHE
jgi:protease IV